MCWFDRNVSNARMKKNCVGEPIFFASVKLLFIFITSERYTSANENI